MTTHSDSDWAGDKESRKSSSGGIAVLGTDVEGYTRKQNIIARGSAESELYAAGFGASGSRGMVSLMRDLGHVLKPVLVTPRNTFSEDKGSVD